MKLLKLFPFIIMFLGTYAGSHGTSKAWRRFAIPISFFLLAIFTVKNLWSLTILLQYIPFSMGHGIASQNDEGSRLGKFYFKIFKGNETLINIFTRGTVSFLLSLCFIGVPVIKNNWVEYILCSLGIILTFAFVQWRNLGSYKFNFFGKEIIAPYSDVICYLVLGIGGYLIII